MRNLGSAALLIVAGAMLGSGCEPPPRPPNVVLVSIDTLRADALGAYGGPVATPSFDRFASQGTLFEVAIAPSAETAPSHATLLTGRRILEHGVRKNGIPLRAEVESLAERFRQEGWATAAFVSSFVLDRRFGWADGFDLYDSEFSKEGETFHADRMFNPNAFWHGQQFQGFDRRGVETTRRARAWLESVREPFFLFVHYFDAHEPHAPPAPYRRRVAGVPFDLGDREVPNATPGLVESWVRGYYADVLYQDDALGGLLAALDAPGVRDRTVVAVTADHGQGLGQHGWLGHQVSLHEELVRVPLVIRWPGRIAAGRRIEAQVALTDIAQTLTELAGIGPPRGVQGRSLAAALVEQAPLEPRPVFGYRRRYAEPFYGRRGDQLSARTPEWKYIRGSLDPDELFDLRSDPGETRNVVGARPEVARRLGALLDAWVASAPPDEPAPTLSDETRRGLEALGYLE